MKNVLRLAGLIAFMAVAAERARNGRDRDMERGLRFPGHQRAADDSFGGCGERGDGHCGRASDDAGRDPRRQGGRRHGDFLGEHRLRGKPTRLCSRARSSMGQIDFSFGTEDGSWGTTLTAKNGEVPAVKPSVSGRDGELEGRVRFPGDQRAADVSSHGRRQAW